MRRPTPKTLWIVGAAVAIVSGAAWGLMELTTDAETRRIRKLRRAVQDATAELPYQLTIIRREQSSPWPPYYTYVSICDGQRLELGPVNQYSFETALDLARQQYRARFVSPLSADRPASPARRPAPVEGRALFASTPCTKCEGCADAETPGSVQCPECGRQIRTAAEDEN